MAFRAIRQPDGGHQASILLRWSFAFWVGQVVVIAVLLSYMLMKYRSGGSSIECIGTGRPWGRPLELVDLLSDLRKQA